VADEGTTSVVVCPVGFVADHLEVLYDLDVEAHGLAQTLGVAFARTRSLDDDPGFCAVLAGVVRRAAANPIGAMAAVSEPTPPA
jgi:protoporphyrin/coproporphyrin ferrochelatase